MKPTSKKIARLDNNLALHAQYNLSSLEQKIVLLLVARLEPTKFGNVQRVAFADIRSFLEHSKWGSAYDRIKECLDMLSTKQLRFDGPVIIGESQKEFGRINWFQSIFLVRENEQLIIEFQFSEAMKPFLQELKQYVRINTIDILNFQSKHSLRLYQVFKAERERTRRMGQNETLVSLPIEDIKRILSIDSSYSTGDLKRYVVNQTEKEINKNSQEINIRTSYKKTGRRISHIEFYVTDAYAIEPTGAESLDRVWSWSQINALEKLLAFGVYEKQAKTILEDIKGGNVEGYEDLFVEFALHDFGDKVKHKEEAPAVFVSWWQTKAVYSKENDYYWKLHDRLNAAISKKSFEEKENRRIAKSMSKADFIAWYKAQQANE